MSTSSLWGLDKDYRGEEIAEFENPWLLSPIIWDILFEKYLSEELYDPYGKRSYRIAVMFDPDLFKRLNKKINESTIQIDRILWELSNEQLFFTKDKQFIIFSLNQFLEINSDFTKGLGSHIHERFREVACEIENLDNNQYPYFVFKNTSVDNNVEFWFRRYDEENQDYPVRSLKELDQHVAEFVFIEEQKVKKFISNLDYFCMLRM
ncbi:hypothetical protein SMD22_00680 (plasmid) [Brevibacillus halotolerans]|nr:hypothetical protein SMD22_00680 [Brevibacillus halotolerans]